MAGTTRKLGSPEVAAVIDARYAAAADGWRKRRLLAVPLATQGEQTSAEVGAVRGAAHFAQLRGVSLEWDRSGLADLASSEPGAIQVLVRAQAGCPLRADAPRLPARVIGRPTAPELNPCAQLWDIVKDATANRAQATITELRKAMRATLRRYWADAASVLRLIGRNWFLAELNAISKSPVSV